MKLFIGLTTLLLTSIAFASPLSSKLDQKSSDHSNPPVFRQALAKITIFRSKIVKVGDEYTEVKENICSQDVPFSVWDLRNESNQDGWPTKHIECKTTFEGKEMTAYVFFIGLVANFDMAQNIKSPLLSISAYFSLMTSHRVDSYPVSMQSRDLNTTSLLNTLGAQHPPQCPNQGCPSPEHSEVINAQFEYVGQ